MKEVQRLRLPIEAAFLKKLTRQIKPFWSFAGEEQRCESVELLNGLPKAIFDDNLIEAIPGSIPGDGNIFLIKRRIKHRGMEKRKGNSGQSYKQLYND